MRIYELPPVVAWAEVEIKAGIETVWEILSSIDHWPEWNADIKSAKIYGALAPGSIFVWKAGSMTITSTISQVQKPGNCSHSHLAHRKQGRRGPGEDRGVMGRAISAPLRLAGQKVAARLN